MSFDAQPYGEVIPEKLRKNVEGWRLATGADLTFNLGLFNMKAGPSYGLGCSFVRTKKGDMSYGYSDCSRRLEIDYANMCCGYSNGIIDNVIKINNPFGGSRTRNGIGLADDGFVIIAQTSITTTEKAFCRKVLSDVNKNGKKVKLFLLMDGGGSTSMSSGFSRLNFYPEGVRKVTSVANVYLIHPIKIDDYSPKKDEDGKPIARVLKRGCRGEDVKWLQMVLGGIECDGIFGTGTLKRLRDAQRKLGLKVDGYCGPATKKALGFI